MGEKPLFLYSFNYRYKTEQELLEESEEGKKNYYNIVKRLYDLSNNGNTIYVIMHKNEAYEEFKDLQNDNFKIILPSLDKMIEDKQPLWNEVNNFIKSNHLGNGK